MSRSEELLSMLIAPAGVHKEKPAHENKTVRQKIQIPRLIAALSKASEER
jgi:hypothetical protein